MLARAFLLKNMLKTDYNAVMRGRLIILDIDQVDV